MPIISIEFTLFFLIFFPIYWSFKRHVKIQNVLLLFAGLGWLLSISWIFAFTVTLFSACISFIGYLLATSQIKRKAIFILGVGLSLFVLAFFKYVDFFRPVLHQIGISDSLDILMPLGLSYYVFQSIAYLHSEYKREIIIPRVQSLNWYELLLHFSFFPTITSGPIIRAMPFKSIDGIQQGAIAQIKNNRILIFPALAISLVLLGIIKKWWFSGIVAENIVDPIFENPMQYGGLSILAGIYGYTIQLFFDFSGYSDLVIGLAMLLGFQLPKNFSAPLRSINIREFWNRWHISLSTWIRDYIYFPLGGSRLGFARTQLNLLMAMILSGIWHGYGWNFFLWGALHGIALILLNIGDLFCGGQREYFSNRNKYFKALSIFVTFNFVCVTFVIFKTTNLEEAQLIFTALLQNWNLSENLNLYQISFLSLVLINLICYPIWIRLFDQFVNLLSKYSPIFWIIPICFLLFIVVLFAPSGIPGFIYANF